MFASFLCSALAEFAGFRVKECFSEKANTDIYMFTLLSITLSVPALFFDVSIFDVNRIFYCA